VNVLFTIQRLRQCQRGLFVTFKSTRQRNGRQECHGHAFVFALFIIGGTGRSGSSIGWSSSSRHRIVLCSGNSETETTPLQMGTANSIPIVRTVHCIPRPATGPSSLPWPWLQLLVLLLLLSWPAVPCHPFCGGHCPVPREELYCCCRCRLVVVVVFCGPDPFKCYGCSVPGPPLNCV
jgi:hypothetical protein